MIDPEAIVLAAFEHAEDAGVDVVEDRARLDAQTGKIIDVEEAAVVDLVLGHAKKGDAPELVADQPIKLAPVAVKLLDPGFDRSADAFILVGERNELALERARSLRHLRSPLRQVEKKIGHPVQRRVLTPEDKREGLRMDWQLVRVVGPDGETSVLFETEFKFPRSQLFAILRAKHRREQLAVLRRPVDVEPAGILGVGTPLQNIEPQRIVGAPDAPVIGHDVQDPPEPLIAEGVDHRREIILRPEFRIQLVVVGDVVAVDAARTRLEDRREVDVADAELREVRRDGGRVTEPKAGMQLQTIGRARSIHSESNPQRTVQGAKEAPASPQSQNERTPRLGNATALDERLASRTSRRSPASQVTRTACSATTSASPPCRMEGSNGCTNSRRIFKRSR